MSARLPDHTPLSVSHKNFAEYLQVPTSLRGRDEPVPIPVEDAEGPGVIYGVGEYDPASYEANQVALRAARLHKVAGYVLFNLLIITAAVVSVYFVSAWAAIPFALIEAPIFTYSLEWIKKLITCEGGVVSSTAMHSYRADVRHNHLPQINRDWCDVEASYVYADCTETFQSKMRAIRNAKQEILLSGSYCGRACFKEMLELIQERMRANPELKVYILTATRFVTDKAGFDNWKLSKELTEEFPGRFFLTLTFDHVQEDLHSPDFKYVGNHTKYLGIDRRLHIWGGSGVEDRWAYSAGIQPHIFPHETGLVESAIAKSFRDADVATFSHRNLGESIAKEFFKLHGRWYEYCRTKKAGHNQFKKLEKERVKAGYRYAPTENFWRPLKNNLGAISIEDMDMNHRRLIRDQHRVKFTVSGPEMQRNFFSEEVIRQIESAQRKIVISHFYFHPSPDVMRALKQAIERGVEVEIYTNKFYEHSPNSHTIFADRSMFHMRELIGFKPQEVERVKAYVWDVRDSSYHKKVIIIDPPEPGVDQEAESVAVIGSSNFSHKGLRNMGDYEMDGFMKSSEFAKRLYDDVLMDVQHRHLKQIPRAELEAQPGFMEIVKTTVHWLAEKRIG